MHVSFLKKIKKIKKWNGIVVMALPKQEGKKKFAIGLWQYHCQNRGVKKNFVIDLWQFIYFFLAKDFFFRFLNHYIIQFPLIPKHSS